MQYSVWNRQHDFDLYTIKYVWNTLGHRVAFFFRPGLVDVNSWLVICIDKLVLSMKNRYSAVLAVHWDQTQYETSCRSNKSFLSFTCNQLVALNHLFVFFPLFQLIIALLQNFCIFIFEIAQYYRCTFHFKVILCDLHFFACPPKFLRNVY